MTNDIIEMGPELTADEQAQARRVWETKNTQTQARGEPYVSTKDRGVSYRPEPTVSMPSPEQVLIGDLLAIHPDLGLWAHDLARQGYEADYIKGRLNALVQEVEAERA